MDKLFQVILLLVSVYLTIASTKYQACNIHKLDCPLHSICSQLNENDDGECRCPQHFEMNPHSTGPSDYCVEDENSIGDGSAAISSSLGSNKGSKTVVHIQPPPESHHVAIGIFVPILLVVLVMGAVYGIKRFHPVRRLREYVISRRRNRPLYEDVMMTQELEDPPLM
ncbi:uncharacterized protein LOC129950260 [Eupeodes corollae]|uniref:uncharacterized protein LOC129950260 n=1 Tax=Eupeodes corollae TaxID=290404 RepID=UPI00248FA347|nr:uncharacterized protein LOC129950260 [Eupeodes corollae]